MIIGEGERHQLVERHRIDPVVREQSGRHVRQLEPTLHHQRRHAEVGRDVLDRVTFGDQRGEGLELIRRVHRLPLHVLGQAHRAGRAVWHEQARHLEVLGELAPLHQQLEGGEATPARDHVEAFAIAVLHDREVVQQADARDASGEFRD